MSNNASKSLNTYDTVNGQKVIVKVEFFDENDVKISEVRHQYDANNQISKTEVYLLHNDTLFLGNELFYTDGVKERENRFIYKKDEQGDLQLEKQERYEYSRNGRDGKLEVYVVRNGALLLQNEIFYREEKKEKEKQYLYEANAQGNFELIQEQNLGGNDLIESFVNYTYHSNGRKSKQATYSVTRIDGLPKELGLLNFLTEECLFDSNGNLKIKYIYERDKENLMTPLMKREIQYSYFDDGRVKIRELSLGVKGWRNGDHNDWKVVSVNNEKITVKDHTGAKISEEDYGASGWKQKETLFTGKAGQECISKVTLFFSNGFIKQETLYQEDGQTKQKEFVWGMNRVGKSVVTNERFFNKYGQKMKEIKYDYLSSGEKAKASLYTVIYGQDVLTEVSSFNLKGDKTGAVQYHVSNGKKVKELIYSCINGKEVLTKEIIFNGNEVKIKQIEYTNGKVLSEGVFSGSKGSEWIKTKEVYDVSAASRGRLESWTYNAFGGAVEAVLYGQDGGQVKNIYASRTGWQGIVESIKTSANGQVISKTQSRFDATTNQMRKQLLYGATTKVQTAYYYVNSGANLQISHRVSYSYKGNNITKAETVDKTGKLVSTQTLSINGLNASLSVICSDVQYTFNARCQYTSWSWSNGSQTQKSTGKTVIANTAQAVGQLFQQMASTQAEGAIFTLQEGIRGNINSWQL